MSLKTIYFFYERFIGIHFIHIMIDTHCHLYSKEFEADIDQVMEKAIAAGIQRFYMPAIDSSTTDAMLAIEQKYPEAISMMGLHPCSVEENYESELLHVTQWLQKRKFAAIGEVGLDFYWDKTFMAQQYIAFKQQISMALEYSLPVIIHSRNATKETTDVIASYKGTNLKGIFHCFGGSVAEAKEIIGLGFLLGIGGVVTYKNAGLGEVLREIDLEHIVLETDAPYLAPVPFRGKRNESVYLTQIAEKIAECKNVPLAKVIDITTKNALSIFSL